MITLKKLAILVVVLVLLSEAAFAGRGIGLFTGDWYDSYCEVINPAGFFPFEFWIWCLPDYDVGQVCAEFKLCYPPNVIQSTVTWNDPIISVLLGDLPSGVSVCFITCHYYWLWICHQSCYLTDTTPSFIEIYPHPDVGVIQFASCEPSWWAPYEVPVWHHLALNQPCVIGTKESSWGVIKSMVGE